MIHRLTIQKCLWWLVSDFELSLTYSYVNLLQDKASLTLSHSSLSWASMDQSYL